MSLKIYYDKDADISLIKSKKVCIIGYGSQGRAHALNLKDSGINVVVGLRRESKTFDEVQKDGLKAEEIEKAVLNSDFVMILSPDEVQKDIYSSYIEKNLKNGATLAFAHGLNIHFSLIEPREDLDVVMIAPKGPGYKVREEFEKGMGVPCLVCIHQNKTGDAMKLALSYASAIGGGRSGVIETTFKEECETDLFGEQAVLCGGVPYLMKLGFETLVEAGYSPEMAYFECIHEMKLIVDLIYEGGFEKMNEFISNTAEYGAYVSAKKVIDGRETKAKMKEVLAKIQSGKFVSKWMTECNAGQPMLKTLRKNESLSLLSEVGKKLRNMMKWKH